MLVDKTIDLYLGAVYDALNLLGYGGEQQYIDIKPTAGYSGLVYGPAFTTKGRRVSLNEKYSELDNIRLEMYEPGVIRAGSIIVLESNDARVAHSGDVTSKIYKKLGAAGFLTDGLVRDVDVIDDLAFPVFSRGENPIDALDYWALTEYQVGVTINGVGINPGDYIFMSRDGVLVVPSKILDEFQMQLKAVIKKENRVRERIDQCSPETLGLELMRLVETGGRW